MNQGKKFQLSIFTSMKKGILNSSKGKHLLFVTKFANNISYRFISQHLTEDNIDLINKNKYIIGEFA